MTSKWIEGNIVDLALVFTERLDLDIGSIEIIKCNAAVRCCGSYDVVVRAFGPGNIVNVNPRRLPTLRRSAGSQD